MGKVIQMKRRYPTYEEYERDHPGISPLEYYAAMATREQCAKHIESMPVEVTENA